MRSRKTLFMTERIVDSPILSTFADGNALKYRNSTSQYHPGIGNGNGYINPCLQASVDQISTISRPRSSTDAVLTQPGGSPGMHNGRHLNGVLSRGANGLHEDLDFPPTPRTLTRKKNVVWMRPHVSFSCCAVFGYLIDLHRAAEQLFPPREKSLRVAHAGGV